MPQLLFARPAQDTTEECQVRKVATVAMRLETGSAERRWTS